MKIKDLYINEYKMFENFKINFTDKDNNPLDIIVLAGVNGSGKTTLLEYIYNFMEYLENQNSRVFLRQKLSSLTDYIDVVSEQKPKGLGTLGSQQGLGNLSSQLNNPLINYKIEKENFEKYKSEYNQKIIYIPTLKDNVEDIKNFILERHRKRSRQLDSIKNATKEIEEVIKKIFDGIDLSFSLIDVNDIERDNEKVIFKNKGGKEFDIENLSTGEKTLLSKVLYLYFKDVENQIILIDEPELSLHPAWQNKVLKLYENFAKSNNCQIIIATHSPHIIGSAKNEYIRLLTTNEENEIKVVDKDLYAHGRDINSILFDVMGEVRYRPLKEFDEKIDYLYHHIDEQEFDKAKEILKELEKDYGKNDKVILEAKMTIDMLNYQD